MSDEAMPGWADTLMAAMNRNTRVLERVETSIDQATRALQNLQIRVTSLEQAVGHGFVRDATQSGRLDDLEARLLLIGKRLELRDRP